jgi:hypothetical protein
MSQRALRIDASTGVISEVVIKDYRDIQEKIGCDIFTVVTLAKGEVLYVDDEGLINGTTKGFSINYGSGFLMGNGLVLGADFKGDSVDTKLSPADMIEKFGVTHTIDTQTGEKHAVKSAANYN